jgi:HK97 gp10 family phage protein
MLKSRLPEITERIPPSVHHAVEAGAELVAEGARQRVPVATGRLRDAIHVDTEPEGAYVIAGDSKAFYGMFVEHGTRYMPAHPFLLPALEENRSEIEHLVDNAIREVT